MFMYSITCVVNMFFFIQKNSKMKDIEMNHVLLLFFHYHTEHFLGGFMRESSAHLYASEKSLNEKKKLSNIFCNLSFSRIKN